MKRTVTAFVAGLVFALGLGISGMTQPEKVIGFLDVTGSWDPSLAFVMIGAILVFSIGYRLVLRREKPVFGPAFQLPDTQTIDGKLIVGAVLFGLGWGLAGFCPGPGVVSLVSLQAKPILFVGSMALGMIFYQSGSRR